MEGLIFGILRYIIFFIAYEISFNVAGILCLLGINSYNLRPIHHSLLKFFKYQKINTFTRVSIRAYYFQGIRETSLKVHA